ncbi:MAG: hypothetical protein LQ338_006497 [Usnochroma carphineum]|nr:MAG: hypothetical protein LQ338_006497 [Usnochroma carphineum]
MFRYQYNDETDGAIRLLEQALKTLANAEPTVREENASARRHYDHMLARLYFDAGVSARENGTNAWPYTKRLKQLATVTRTVNEDFADFFDFYGPGYASMLWGCWLRTYERAEEDVWKKTFKVRLLDELNMLDDEDPSNDMVGLHSLAITLLHLGDDEAAGAILAVLFMPLKAWRETVQEDVTSDEGDGRHEGNNLDYKDKSDGDKDESDGEKDDGQGWEKVEAEGPEGGNELNAERRAHDGDTAGQGIISSPQATDEAVQDELSSNTNAALDRNSPPPHLRRTADHVEAVTIDGKTRLALSLDISWIHRCNGPCSNNYQYTSLYICNICLGTKFCGECLQLVKEERLVCRDCSPHHSWYKAWPVPEGKAEVAAEFDGERWMIRKKWLDELRGEWL